MQLRDYQQCAYDQALVAVRAKRKPLIVIGTGGGKTAVMAILTKSAVAAKKRVIIAAPLTELIQQQFNTLLRVGFNQNSIGILQGNKSDSYEHLAQCQVVVAMAQSLQGERGKIFLRDNKFQVCLQDEKHLQRLDAVEKLVGAPINMGFTATPIRECGQEYLEEYEWIEPISTSELIRQGNLVKFIHYLYQETTQIDSPHPDYTPQEQKQILRNITPEFVLRQWLKVRPSADYTLGFCSSIDEAEKYAAYFTAQGYKAMVCSQKTPDKDRRLKDGTLLRGFPSIKEDFRSGKVKVIFTVIKLATGFDEPLAKCLLNLRPTKSLALWHQMFGRVLRPILGLVVQLVAQILDFAGCGTRLPLPTEIDSFSEYLKTRKQKVKMEGCITRSKIEAMPVLPTYRKLAGSMIGRQDPRLIQDDLELIRELRYQAFWVYQCSPGFVWNAFNQVRKCNPPKPLFKGVGGVLQHAIFGSPSINDFLAYKSYLDLYQEERNNPTQWKADEIKKEFGVQGLIWLRQYQVISK